MIRFIRLVAVGLLAIATVAAQGTFSQRLTPQERKNSGLDQLTAEQVAVLDALIAREREAPVPAPPATARAQTQSAPVKPTATAVVAPPAEDQAQKKARWFGLAAPKAEEESITGTLDGEFRGWTGETVFRLTDGQVWVQVDHGDSYVVTQRPQNPPVKITKSAIGGYKLTVGGNPRWVRVRRLL